MRAIGPVPPAMLFLVIAVVVLVAASGLDGWTYAHIGYAEVYERDWGRMLRVVGFLPTWGAVAIAIALCDRPRPDWARRGALLFASAALGGIVAELLKLAVRRERPSAAGYVFRAWGDHPLSTRGLGFPSSHAMVAFAAAAMLARLFPKARVVWYALAAGCAVTRLLAHAHYLSDVAGGALVAYALAHALWQWSARSRTVAEAVR